MLVAPENKNIVIGRVHGTVIIRAGTCQLTTGNEIDDPVNLADALDLSPLIQLSVSTLKFCTHQRPGSFELQCDSEDITSSHFTIHFPQRHESNGDLLNL